jgi:hypothetical protein
MIPRARNFYSTCEPLVLSECKVRNKTYWKIPDQRWDCCWVSCTPQWPGWLCYALHVKTNFKLQKPEPSKHNFKCGAARRSQLDLQIYDRPQWKTSGSWDREEESPGPKPWLELEHGTYCVHTTNIEDSAGYLVCPGMKQLEWPETKWDGERCWRPIVPLPIVPWGRRGL